jgi:hypothetical protein
MKGSCIVCGGALFHRRKYCSNACAAAPHTPRSFIDQRAATIAARAGTLLHAGQRYALTWVECPCCGGEA